MYCTIYVKLLHFNLDMHQPMTKIWSEGRCAFTIPSARPPALHLHFSTVFLSPGYIPNNGLVRSLQDLGEPADNPINPSIAPCPY